MRVDPKIGSEFAGHRIEAVIGRGGASVVYLAEHLRLRRKVALKVLDPEIAEDEAFRERFIRESRIAAGLDHPNIITVFDAGEAEGVLFISMRYVEGADLERVLRSERSLGPDRTISIVSQCAAALDVAHAEGLVHRDVKPANILLASDGRGGDHVYLADFGITKRKHSDAGLTRTGQFVGTVDYVAPEQILGQSIDGRADVYSLGCVLYRCLTGEVPFPRDTEVATVYGHLEDPPPVPTERSSDLPRAIDGVVARALAKSRDARFSSCVELSDEAAAALQIDARRAKSSISTPTTHPSHSKGGLARIGGPRRRLLSTVLAAVVIASIGIAGWVVLGGSSGSTHGGADGSTSSATGTGLKKLVWHVAPYRPNVFGGHGDQDMARALSLGAQGVVLAVGHDESAGNRDAAVWTSKDGVRWDKVSDRSLEEPFDQLISGAALFGDEVVAVGWDSRPVGTDAAVWTSMDAGRSWDRVRGASSGLHGSGDQKMRRVVSTNSGLVAVGSASGPAGDLDAAAWTSTDGDHWTSLSNEDFTGAANQEAFDVTQFNDELVIVGYTTTASGDEDAAVWVRSGDSWISPHQSLEAAGDQRMISVAVGERGLVAVGTESTPQGDDAVVWTSSDGLNWNRVADTACQAPCDQGIFSKVFGRPGDQQMYTVTNVGSSIVVGGVSGRPDEGTDAAVWVSGEGVPWELEDSNDVAAAVFGGTGEQQIKSLVVFKGRIVAVGSAKRLRDDGAEAWWARVPSSWS